MVQINFAQKEIQCKIVYYGPGMSGKTTNLEIVHGKVPEQHRGELTSIATTGERTLYFDYMPLDLGQIAGIRTKFQLYTVPGQIYYKSTRRLVLQGVDGIVFVADSSRAKLRENKESLADLEENLQEMGKSLHDIPILIQYNKRDVADAMSVAELEQELNPHGLPSIEAIATSGEGVFPTLKKLAASVLESVNQGGVGAKASAPPTRPVRVQQAPTGSATPSPGQGSSAAAGNAVVQPPSGSQPAIPIPGLRPPAPSVVRPAATASPGAGLRSTIGPAAPNWAAQGQTGATAVAAPPRPATSAQPAQAHAAPPAIATRAMQDRVVHVAGLSRRRTNSKLVTILGLAAIITAAAWWLLTRT